MEKSIRIFKNPMKWLKLIAKFCLIFSSTSSQTPNWLSDWEEEDIHQIQIHLDDFELGGWGGSPSTTEWEMLRDSLNEVVDGGIINNYSNHSEQSERGIGRIKKVGNDEERGME